MSDQRIYNLDKPSHRMAKQSEWKQLGYWMRRVPRMVDRDTTWELGVVGQGPQWERYGPRRIDAWEKFKTDVLGFDGWTHAAAEQAKETP